MLTITIQYFIEPGFEIIAIAYQFPTVKLRSEIMLRKLLKVCHLYGTK